MDDSKEPNVDGSLVSKWKRAQKRNAGRNMPASGKGEVPTFVQRILPTAPPDIKLEGETKEEFIGRIEAAYERLNRAVLEAKSDAKPTIPELETQIESLIIRNVLKRPELQEEAVTPKAWAEWCWQESRTVLSQIKIEQGYDQKTWDGVVTSALEKVVNIGSDMCRMSFTAMQPLTRYNLGLVIRELRNFSTVTFNSMSIEASDRWNGSLEPEAGKRLASRLDQITDWENKVIFLAANLLFATCSQFSNLAVFTEARGTIEEASIIGYRNKVAKDLIKILEDNNVEGSKQLLQEAMTRSNDRFDSAIIHNTHNSHRQGV